MNRQASENGGMQQLWQNQQTEGFPVSVDQIRVSAGRFQRKVSRRNVRESLAALVVVIFFGAQMVMSTGMLLRTGDLLVIAASIYVIWHLWSRGSALPLPEDAGLSNWIEFRKRELGRQRDLLSSVWRWYMGPVIPGLALVLIAGGLANPALHKHPYFVVAFPALAIAALFVVVGWLNHRAARRLQRQIDELDALSRG